MRLLLFSKDLAKEMILRREKKAANLSSDMIGQFGTISCDYLSTWG